MNPLLLPGLKAKRNAVRLGSLLLKLALFLPLPAFCQGRAVSVAKIPFGFSVDGKALPAGEYVLYRDSANMISLRTRSGLLAQRMLVYGDSAGRVPETSKFVFRSGLDGYSLESFWTAGSREGMRLVHRRHKREEVAARSADNTVMIAATSPMSPPK